MKVSYLNNTVIPRVEF